jgi:hypothetical protein
MLHEVPKKDVIMFALFFASHKLEHAGVVRIAV